MIALTVSNIIKIVLLLKGYNIIVIQAGYVLVSLGQAIFYTLLIKKKYPWIDLSVKPDFESISQRKAVLVHQVTSLVFNNTDMLLLTFACRDLRIVSVYSIYGLIYNNIDNITATINAAYKPLLGQLYFEDRTRFLKTFEISETFYMAFSYAIYFVAFLLTPWFVNLYTKNADISYADYWIPILFVAMKLLGQMRRPLLSVIDIAGDFKNTQGRTIAEMGINIALSIALVWRFQIYGVLIGTIVAMLYRNTDVLLYVPKHLIDHNAIQTLKRWLIYLALFVLGCYAWRYVPQPIDSVFWFIVYGVILTILSLALFLGIAAITNRVESKNLILMIKQHIRK